LNIEMTNDEIMQAAKEAGFKVAKYDSYVEIQPCVFGQSVNVEVAKLIAIIEKRTIERCAVVAEELRHPDGFSGENVDWCAGTDHAAAAIRKLGEQ